MKRLEKKDKIELMITVFLIVVFIMLTAAFLRRKKAPQLVSRRASGRIFSTSPQFRSDSRRNKGATFLWERNMGVLAGVETKRDPFSYGSAGNNQGGEPLLKGIIWSLDQPYAVINEQTVGIGDAIGNFKVKQITQDSVVLESENSQLELKLNR